MQLAFEKMKMQMQAAVEAAKLQIKQQENMLKAEELGMRKEIEREKLNLEALDRMIKLEGLDIEKINPNKNIIADGN